MNPRLDSREAWTVTTASLLILAVAFAAPYVATVALKPIADEFGGLRAVPSGATSLACLGMGVGGLGMGWLADRIGVRCTVCLVRVMVPSVGSVIDWWCVATLDRLWPVHRPDRQRSDQRAALRLCHAMVRPPARGRAGTHRQRSIYRWRPLAADLRADDSRLWMAVGDAGLRRHGAVDGFASGIGLSERAAGDACPAIAAGQGSDR